MDLPTPDPADLLSHAAFVRSVARAALVGDAEVEDVVQETWLAALQGGARPLRSPRAWLASVARRQAALLIRRRTRERRRIEGLARVEDARSSPPDWGAEALVRAETGRRLVDALLTLPEVYRSVLLLRYQDDLAPREVARRLDVPVETVRTRARRGLEQLRECLGRTERERGADWRTSLLLLCPQAAQGVSTTSVTLLGAVAVKKWIAIAASLLLLVGSAWLSWDLLASPAERDSSAAGVAPMAEVRTVPQDEAPAPARLAGIRAAAAPSLDGGPSAVDLATVDRERDLHGTLRDAQTDGPVSGAELVLLEKVWARATSFDPGASGEQVRGTTVSAADGSWRIRLEPGDLVDLEVRAAGYAAHGVRAVQAGERLDLRLERGTSLRVRVLDARGQVRPAARVRASHPPHGTRDGRGFATLDAVTDEAGLCVLRGLPPGAAVALDVSHPVGGTAMWRETRAPESGTAEVEVILPPGRTLSGEVTDARTGAPVAGARVGIGWLLDATVLTDETGSYTLPAWTAKGVHEVAVRAEGYAQDEALVGDRTRIDFALAPGDRIRGRVLDRAGHAVAGAKITALGSSRETGRQITSSGSTRSGEDGRFEIRDLRHDMPHRLIVYARGHGRTLRAASPPPAAGGIRDIGDIRLAPAGVVAGLVQRADGTPVSRVAVLLGLDPAAVGDGLGGSPTFDHGYGLNEERYTDDLGRFLFPDVGPGGYTVTVRQPGGSPQRRAVALSAEHPRAELTLTLDEGRVFAVRVEDEAGRPVDQALTFVSTADGERLDATTDASGRATYALAGEPVRVSVSTTFELTGKRYIAPPEAEVPQGSSEVRVVLTPADVIRGVVLDEEERPLTRVTLRAVQEDVQLADGWTRRDGSFQLTVPRHARVDIELVGTRLEESASGFTAHDAFLEGGVEGVKAGDEGVVVRARTVARTGTITVRVTDPAGRALADAIVLASRPEGEGLAMARTGAEGEAVLLALPRAQLELIAARAPLAEGEQWVVPRAVRAVPSGQTLTLAYRLGAPVEGVVLDGDGKPVAGERVEVAYEDGGYHATTNANGRFVALVPAAAAEVRVRLLNAGDAGAPRSFVTARPGDRDVLLLLE